jgi:hypothetical protein
MILSRGFRASAKTDGRPATHAERVIYTELRKKMNAKAPRQLFLAVGGPFDGKLLWLPQWCDGTMVSRWRGSNGQWYGRYSQDNSDRLPSPYQVGHGRPCMYWENKSVPIMVNI